MTSGFVVVVIRRMREKSSRSIERDAMFNQGLEVIVLPGVCRGPAVRVTNGT